MSDHHHHHHAAATADNTLENPPLLSHSPPRHRDSTPSTLSALIPLFLLLTAATLSLAATVTLILSVQTKFEVDSFHISSFNISGDSWSAILSFNQSESSSDRGAVFADPGVAYEARSWLYSRNGFVAVNSPSMSSGGGELALKSNFSSTREIGEEAAADGGILTLDVLIEANATRRGSGTASYLSIECGDLEIEFAGDRSLGVLSGGDKGRCGVQIYATKSDAVDGGRIVDLLRRLFLLYRAPTESTHDTCTLMMLFRRRQLS